MAVIVVRKRLSQVDAEDLISRLEKWWKLNPRRKIARVGDGSAQNDFWFKVRKKHIREDVMEHAL